MLSFVVKKLLPPLAGSLLVASIAVAAPAKAAKTSAANPSTADVSYSDPLEPFNRAMFSFNRGFDTYLLRPVTYGYRYITPQGIRTRIGNASDNILEPVNMLNAFLQGDFTQGMTSFWRFVINSTVGIGGLNDVAAEAGLPRRTEDFGQTLATWGVGEGPYIVWPILGSSNARDTVGFVADIFSNPLTYYVERNDLYAVGAAQAVVVRDRWFDPIDETYASSLDPYTTFRSIYEQRRAAQIANRGRDRSFK